MPLDIHQSGKRIGSTSSQNNNNSNMSKEGAGVGLKTQGHVV